MGRSDSNEGRGEERALFTRLRGIERGEGRGLWSRGRVVCFPSVVVQPPPPPALVSLLSLFVMFLPHLQAGGRSFPLGTNCPSHGTFLLLSFGKGLSTWFDLFSASAALMTLFWGPKRGFPPFLIKRLTYMSILVFSRQKSAKCSHVSPPFTPRHISVIIFPPFFSSSIFIFRARRRRRESKSFPPLFLG